MNDLTVKQKKFADEYIISGNATEAYKKAGYRVSSDRIANVEGHKLLRNPKVKSYIDIRLKEFETQKIAQVEEVLQVYTAILRQEMVEEVTALNPITGEFVTVEKKPSISDVIKAANELMKRYPNAKVLEKLELEVERLKQQVRAEDPHDDTTVTGFTFDRGAIEDGT